MSTAPTLNGQVIGQAHYATRALLETVLAPDRHHVQSVGGAERRRGRR